MKRDLPCPCGSGRSYGACCGIYHGGTAAPTAEALMRSRYTAYALGLREYVLATWHPSTRPGSLDLDEPPLPKWIGLEVKSHLQENETTAAVGFVARYKVNGRAHRLAEDSRFVREDGRWYYVSGEVSP